MLLHDVVSVAKGAGKIDVAILTPIGWGCPWHMNLWVSCLQMLISENRSAQAQPGRPTSWGGSVFAFALIPFAIFPVLLKGNPRHSSELKRGEKR